MVRKIFSTVLAASVLAAVGNAGSAGAAISYIESFGSAGAGRGQLSGPSGIAVNNATGAVYVADAGNNRIQQLDDEGNFIRMWGASVNLTSGGDVCPRFGNPGDVCGAGDPSILAGAFNSPAGVAVDNSTGPAAGSVYVWDRGNLRIQRFTADGEFVLTWGRAVNQTSGGDLCPRPASPGDTCKSGLTSPDQTGGFGPFSFFAFFTRPGASLISTDGLGHVYMADHGGDQNATRIQEFDSSGAFVAQMNRQQVNSNLTFGVLNPHYVAADSLGRVYVSDGGGSISTNQGVRRFSPDDFTADGLDASYDVDFDVTGDLSHRSRPLAVDPSNQYLFLAHSGTNYRCPDGASPTQHVYEYEPGGELVDCTPESTPFVANAGEWNAMAISDDHRLYAVIGNQVRVFETPIAEAPVIGTQHVSAITTSSALVKAPIAGNLAPTEVHVEYGPEPCSSFACASSEAVDIGASRSAQTRTVKLTDLTPGATYYYRVLADNGIGGPVAGPDRRFSTFASQDFDPSCPNNNARQQTSAAFLFDCRAYELVSAEDQGGYDVESDLVGGQLPFGGYPLASGKALYAIHDGGIPGTGKPTNRGPDPYLSTRDAAHERWNTTYVGVPADAPSAGPFSSTLAGADSGLENFAFSGPEICHPCFGDGSAGIPVHREDGILIQGMAGSLPVATPVPAGEVRKLLSADGAHLIFGSEQQFEPAGNPETGDITIYERDLDAGTTQVVSTLPGGETIAAGDEVAALDVSTDGTRVLIGRKVSTDSAGNGYWHLYMHVGSSPDSIDLTPGTTTGVLYGGMTGDGGKVYFTTPDPLTTESDQDTDTGADLFRADVSATSASLTRVSIGGGGTGDTDSCDPASNSYNSDNWNVVPGGPTDCSIVAVGGGSGVAVEDGVVYFLSPEQLDGEGVEGAPNLFEAHPGESPEFVATLESSANAPFELGPIYQRSLGSYKDPVGVAIDGHDGDAYVMDLNGDAIGAGGLAYIEKLDANGDRVTTFAGDGKLNGADNPNAVFHAATLTGVFGVNVPLPAQIAVDNSETSTAGDIYVPEIGSFASGPYRLVVFNSSGAYQSSISLFERPVAVAVNPTNGDVSVSSATTGAIYTFTNSGALKAIHFGSKPAIGLAVNSGGDLYATVGSKVTIYKSGGGEAILDEHASKGVAVDPVNNHVYVDLGNGFLEYDSSGNQLGGMLGGGQLAGSISLGANGGRILVSDDGSEDVAEYELGAAPGRAYDSPLVIGSVRSPEESVDNLFQTTPSGDHAVVASVLPLTGIDTGEKYELYRSDVAGGPLRCVSCSPTEEAPTTDAKLATDGLSITDDGRVFFNTGEALALRDTNARLDAYEWVPEGSGKPACERILGCTELISTGQSLADSGLLSVTADGTDALFFTRQVLVASDRNGSLLKLYDARAGGGFFHVLPSPRCAASDECHGPGTQAAPPEPLGSLRGTGGQVRTASKPKCPKGKVRRHRRCERRHGKPGRQHRKGMKGGDRAGRAPKRAQARTNGGAR